MVGRDIYWSRQWSVWFVDVIMVGCVPRWSCNRSMGQTRCWSRWHRSRRSGSSWHELIVAMTTVAMTTTDDLCNGRFKVVPWVATTSRADILVRTIEVARV